MTDHPVIELPSVAAAREAPPREGCDGLRAPEVLARVPGLTYRQLDYWSRSDRLFPHTHDTDTAGGSGHPYCWPPGEIAAAARMFRLISLGFNLDTAADLARSREKVTVTSRLLAALAEDMPDETTAPPVPPGFVEGL
jgi:hypothetical protein